MWKLLSYSSAGTPQAHEDDLSPALETPVEKDGDSADFSVPTSSIVSQSQQDVAAGFLRQVADEDASLLAEWTVEEEQKLVRWRIDPIILPLSAFCYYVGGTDKNILGSAAVIGLRQDLHLVGQQYSWTSSILFFGAICGVFPTLWAMQRTRTGLYIAANVFMWGVLSMCLAACQDFSQFMAVRFLLGLFESVIFAGLGLIITAWWKKSEQPWRTAFIYAPFSTILSGPIAYGAASFTGKLQRWRLLFLLVGGMTIVLAILLLLFLPDNPSRARWLTKRQKTIAVRRLADNRTGIANKVFKWSQVREAVMDPKLYFFFLLNLAQGIPVNGILTFNGIFINSLGYSPKVTMLLAIPTGVVAWFWSLVWAVLIVKTGKRFIFAMLSVIPAMVGAIMLLAIPRSHKGASLTAVYILWSTWGVYVTTQTIMFAHTAGHSKKIVVFAAAYVGYAAGNLIGPQTFRASQAPRYQSGLGSMIGCWGAVWILMGLYWLYVTRLNKRKAEQLRNWQESRGNKSTLIEDWQDLTDFKNPQFVYLT